MFRWLKGIRAQDQGGDAQAAAEAATYPPFDATESEVGVADDLLPGVTGALRDAWAERWQEF